MQKDARRARRGLKKKDRVKAGLCLNRGCILDDTNFKNCSACRKKITEKARRNWAGNKVRSAIQGDRICGRISRDFTPPDFIDRPWVLDTREEQQNKCFVCNIELQTKKMNLHDGLTIDRFDNDLAHLKSNCAITCWKCNISNCLAAEIYMRKRRAEVAAMNVD